MNSSASMQSCGASTKNAQFFILYQKIPDLHCKVWLLTKNIFVCFLKGIPYF